jgi:hypothetical protein
MLLPIRPPQPGDPPPPSARKQSIYLVAFFLALLAIVGAFLYLGGRPLT